MSLPTKDEMRARFWELKNAIDAADAAIQPVVDQMSALNEQRAALNAQKKALEADVGVDGLSMFDAKMELAFLARGLGNVGAPA